MKEKEGYQPIRYIPEFTIMPNGRLIFKGESRKISEPVKGTSKKGGRNEKTRK